MGDNDSITIYLGFDDTDNLQSDMGTGKLARYFQKELPDDCQLWGVVRQQLLVRDEIPYTSHNSAACLIVHAPGPSVETLIAKAVKHVEHHAAEGSDPGICMAWEGNGSFTRLVDFGYACAKRVVRQKEALEAASGLHLSGHGGTNDGIIGAAAAVGLTISGWSGRFIEYGALRRFSDLVRVSELWRAGIRVVSMDRDALIPGPEDRVYTNGWVRPRLWGHRAVLTVKPKERGVWISIGKKRNKNQAKKIRQ
jgi:hypothetical protein